MKLVTYDDGSDNEIAGILTQDETGILPLTSIDPSFVSLQAFIEAADSKSITRARTLLDEEPRYTAHRCAIVGAITAPGVDT